MVIIVYAYLQRMGAQHLTVFLMLSWCCQVKVGWARAQWSPNLHSPWFKLVRRSVTKSICSAIWGTMNSVFEIYLHLTLADNRSNPLIILSLARIIVDASKCGSGLARILVCVSHAQESYGLLWQLLYSFFTTKSKCLTPAIATTLADCATQVTS